MTKHPLDSYYDPVRERLVRFPNHWPPAARSYFLNQIGQFLAEEVVRRVRAERASEQNRKEA